MVIDHNLNNGDIISAGGCQFVHIHAETTVTADIDTDLVGLPDFGTDTGTKTVSHGPQAAGT